MSAPVEVVGTMALGHLLPQVAPRWLLYVLAIGGLGYLFRRQIKKILR